MTPPDLSALAASLTEAQRRALLNAQDYDDGSALFRLGTGRGMCPLGLGIRTIDGIELTLLGEQVRAHLTKEKNDADQ